MARYKDKFDGLDFSSETKNCVRRKKLYAVSAIYPKINRFLFFFLYYFSKLRLFNKPGRQNGNMFTNERIDILNYNNLLTVSNNN
jgi:hypothetical protein